MVVFHGELEDSSSALFASFLREALTPMEVMVPPNILILDDSSVMVNTLDSILTSQGCLVESCLDGEACWRRLVAGVDGMAPIPDLLLLDLNTSGIDGLGLLGRIRAESWLADMPVIVLTAKTDAKTRSEALRAGADDCLPKPVELSELLDHVEDALSGLLADTALASEGNRHVDRSYAQPEKAGRPLLR